MSSQTVLPRTTLTRSIILYRLLIFSFVAKCCLLQLNYVKICRSSFCMWGNGPVTILKRFCLLRSRNITFPDLPLLVQRPAIVSLSAHKTASSPGRRFSAGKQGARGVVGRLECTYPTMPRAPLCNKEEGLG